MAAIPAQIATYIRMVDVVMVTSTLSYEDEFLIPKALFQLIDFFFKIKDCL